MWLEDKKHICILSDLHPDLNRVLNTSGSSISHQQIESAFEMLLHQDKEEKRKDLKEDEEKERNIDCNRDVIGEKW